MISIINQTLYQAVKCEPILKEDAQLFEMICYALGFDSYGELIGSGKRLRPLIVMNVCEALCGDGLKALQYGVALEMLHNFSLIHDDIEDNGDLRHGRPTLWKRYGLSISLNCGDLLFALSNQAILKAAGTDAQRALALYNRLTLNLTLGQHLDIAFETLNTVSDSDYLRMVSGKTASLFGGCFAFGALAAGATDSVIEDFYDIGLNFGLSFQIYDDILGIWGNQDETGKSTSGDILSKKKTYPILYAYQKDADFRKEWDTFDANPAKVAIFSDRMDAIGVRSYAQCKSAEFLTQAQEKLNTYAFAPQAKRNLDDLLVSLLNRKK